ncbi:glycosyltransferase family 4 protein [Massilia aerilata]|uniref:Glycosyltransferase family 4 protein n=1 Tax=Massilia aerilata TaxID=453817 RepID=A0ABW0RWI4_9BURK
MEQLDHPVRDAAAQACAGKNEEVDRLRSNPTRVLLIGVLPLWADRGDSIHMREIAVGLQNFNINPVVLCLPGPQAPVGSTLQEVRVQPWHRRFAFQLSWNLLGTIAAVRTIRAQKVEVIYSRLDPGMVVGWLASLLTNRPLVVEMNGLPSEDMRIQRPNKFFQQAITARWEKLMYQVARIVVGSPGYLRYINENFQITSDKCWPVPLGYNSELFYPRSRKVCREALNLSDSPLVVWMGNLTVWQGLETLMKSAVMLKDRLPNARIILVGDGISRKMCEQFIQDEKLHSTVTLVGHVQYEDVPVYLGAADVCVASFPGNRGTPGTISALKTVSYLGCGRPVVTTAMDELGITIQTAGAGFCVAPDNPKALAQALGDLLEESQEENNLRGLRAHEIVADGGSWDHAAGRIAACLQAVVR